MSVVIKGFVNISGVLDCSVMWLFFHWLIQQRGLSLFLRQIGRSAKLPQNHEWVKFLLIVCPSHASSSRSATGCESSAQISAVSIEADSPAMPAYYYYYCAGWPLFSTKTIRLFALDFYEVIVDSAIVVYYDSPSTITNLELIILLFIRI